MDCSALSHHFNRRRQTSFFLQKLLRRASERASGVGLTFPNVYVVVVVVVVVESCLPLLLAHTNWWLMMMWRWQSIGSPNYLDGWMEGPLSCMLFHFLCLVLDHSFFFPQRTPRAMTQQRLRKVFRTQRNNRVCVVCFSWKEKEKRKRHALQCSSRLFRSSISRDIKSPPAGKTTWQRRFQLCMGKDDGTSFLH